MPSCPAPHIITFLDCRGSRHIVGYVCGCILIAEGKQSSHFSIWPIHFSHDDMRVSAHWVSQMPDVFTCPPLLSLPLPLVPAWAQGLNQSIRAPGTGAQQSLCAAQRSTALSGSVHLRPGGEPGGKEGEPWCPCTPVSLEVFSVGAA